MSRVSWEIKRFGRLRESSPYEKLYCTHHIMYKDKWRIKFPFLVEWKKIKRMGVLERRDMCKECNVKYRLWLEGQKRGKRSREDKD